MKFYRPVLVCMALVSCCGQFASGQPEVFSHVSLEQAKAKARQQNRLLLVEFTTNRSGPCHRMDETTWADKDVVAWLRKNSIAIQLDVDKDAESAEELSITAMPTVVVFDPQHADEFDRRTGYLDPPAFLKWMERLRSGDTTLAILKRKCSETAGKGRENVDAHYDLAKYFVESGDEKNAADEFVWLWMNIANEASEMTGVRSTYIAADMSALVRKSQIAKVKFSELRDSEKDNAADWVMLNDILGENRKTFEWFDQQKHDQAFVANLPKNARHHLERVFIHARRLEDYGAIIVDPVNDVKEKFEASQQYKRQFKEFDRFLNDGATIYGALLAAGRNSEANEVADQCVKLHNSADMRLRLIEEWFAVLKSRMLGGTTSISIAGVLVLVAAIAALVCLIVLNLRKADKADKAA